MAKLISSNINGNPLPIDAHVIRVDAEYRDLPITLSAKDSFYSTTRFLNPPLSDVSDFFEENRTLAQQVPGTIHDFSELRTDYYIDNFHIEGQGSIDANLGNTSGNINLQGQVNKAKISIFVSYATGLENFQPPAIDVGGDYYLSQKYYGNSCRISLEFDESQFSSVAEAKTVVMQAFKQDGSVEIKGKINIRHKIGKVNARIIANFPIEAAMFKKVNDTNVNNFFDQMGDIYQGVRDACTTARPTGDVRPILGGTYTQRARINIGNFSAENYFSMATYLMTILLYIHKYTEYYGRQHTEKLSAQKEYFMNLAKDLSNPNGPIRDLVANRQEIDRRLGVVRAQMAWLDAAAYIVSAEWLKIPFRAGQEINSYVNSSNVVAGAMRWSSSKTNPLEAIGRFFQGMLYYMGWPENYRRIGFLQALGADSNVFWTQVRKTCDSPNSHVIRSGDRIKLGSGLTSDERNPFTSHIFEFEIVKVADPRDVIENCELRVMSSIPTTDNLSEVNNNYVYVLVQTVAGTLPTELYFVDKTNIVPVITQLHFSKGYDINVFITTLCPTVNNHAYSGVLHLSSAQLQSITLMTGHIVNPLFRKNTSFVIKEGEQFLLKDGSMSTTQNQANYARFFFNSNVSNSRPSVEQCNDDLQQIILPLPLLAPA